MSYHFGRDVIGGVVPSVGATYTDHDTVLAVQKALKSKGFDPGKFDGIMGPKTAKAIRLMQMAADIPQTGVIDYGVLAALDVTPSLPRLPSDGRPAKGWSQPQPGAIGPAITPDSELSFFQREAFLGQPWWKVILGGVGGSLVVGGIAWALLGGKKRK